MDRDNRDLVKSHYNSHANVNPNFDKVIPSHAIFIYQGIIP